MASIKMLCIVFILTLFGQIRANIDSDAPVVAKQVAGVLPRTTNEVFSLLHTYVQNCKCDREGKFRMPFAVALQSRPIGRSKSVAPTAPVPPTLPAAPIAPVPPSLPVAPVVPVPPTTPVAPSLPSLPNASSVKNVSVNQVLPPSIVYLLYRRPIKPQSLQPVKPVPSSPSIDPKLSPPSRALPPSSQASSVEPEPSGSRISQTTNPIRSAPLPGQLSYDNPSDDNQKLQHIIHIYLPKNKAAHTSPPTTSQTEDLSSLPSDTVASPISAKPDNGQESSNDKNTNTLNVKDLPFQPVTNIEASPIPIRPNDKVADGEKDVKPEDLSPLPSETVGASPIPVKPGQESRDDKNTNTLNIKDLPFQPVTNIEASPIPVRPNDKVAGGAKDVKPENLSPLPSEAAGASPIPAKPGQESRDDKNTNTLNVKDLPFQPVTNIEASPIPVNSKGNIENESDKTNEFGKSPNANAGTSNKEDNTAQKSPQKSEESQNPLGNLILNGTSSNVNTQPEKSQGNPLKDVILNGTSSNDNENTQTNNSQDNPLKDVILNDAVSNTNEQTETNKPRDNPLKDVIVNGSSSNVSEETKTKNNQDNPLKDVILNNTTGNKAEEANNSSAESSNETKSSQEENEDTQIETSQGSSQESTSHCEENTGTSSSSKSNKNSNNASSEDSDYLQK